MKGFGNEEKKKKTIKNTNNSKISSNQILDKAFKAHIKGDIPEAKKNYELLINQGVNDPRVFSNYAIICEQSGNVDKALKLYQHSISLFPNHPDAYSNLGNLFKGIGKLKEAEISQKKAIELEPKFAEAYSNLSDILRCQNKLKEASLSARKAIEINPSLASAYINLGLIFKELYKLKEAENATRKAIELQPKYPNTYSNLGSILKLSGQLKEAEESTRKAIELQPNFAEAYSNLGNILKLRGKFNEAEEITRKAIKLKPNFAEAYSNLGTILKANGQLKEAEESTRKAIELQPNFAEAYSNLGSILHMKGKSEEAEIYTKKAINIKPNLINAHSILGSIFTEQCKTNEAFDSFLEAFNLSQDKASSAITITNFLGQINPYKLNKKKLSLIIKFLLEKEYISHKTLFNSIKYLFEDKLVYTIIDEKECIFEEDSLSFIFKGDIVKQALRKTIFTDNKWELLLTNIRKNTLTFILSRKESIKEWQLSFICALAEQCFLNEYAYYVSKEESLLIENLVNKNNIKLLSEETIAILSCYMSLYKIHNNIVDLTSLNYTHTEFKSLYRLQLKEPLIELELAKSIRKLGLINDNVSKDVQTHYQESPYPRWRDGNPSTNENVHYIDAINTSIKPNIISYQCTNESPQVLIAGCGTGQHILNAKLYKNANITAIDLSLSSLAYAQRKLNEFGIKNVELIQMDILNIHLLEKKFDIIESSGVLHHMNDPLQGLKVLLNILKSKGFMKLGLYSEKARKSIIKGREYIKKMHLNANSEDIRKFRKHVLNEQNLEVENIKFFADFYTTSSCRDLCFHVKEHRFTINNLSEIFDTNELDFLGFTLPQSVKSLYRRDFPGDKAQINLENWLLFEDKYPLTFRGMYQFWVRKHV